MTSAGKPYCFPWFHHHCLVVTKLSEVNRQSVETTASVSISELIARLRGAQKTIEQHIFDESIEIIPYKKGSRGYSREEHLEIVTAHIKKHLKDLKKKLK